ncbi:heavy-metal-associated domain-containing protein [Sporolactobacillus terrae]|uniref:ATPase P n=1 Tax=Sporolactobacillus terrae TaxID=269673 RepID=A0ABX5Q7Q4_9BACL|nr:ATPase P [Sporolactobacillus terrae]QAA25672.1 ATPase P [Sporolactobacillus terrae]UAK17483.1 heavy-metal-associated domain-containing protein [Sporolactobacillus terrae]
MATVIISALLFVFVLFACRSAWKRQRNGCCGNDIQRLKKVKIKGDKCRDYPYRSLLHIDGMTCQNCARKIENGLCSIEGVCATVRLDQKEALVRMKRPLPESLLCGAVAKAGYTVLKVDFLPQSGHRSL